MEYADQLQSERAKINRIYFSDAQSGRRYSGMADEVVVVDRLDLIQKEINEACADPGHSPLEDALLDALMLILQELKNSREKIAMALKVVDDMRREVAELKNG